MTTGADQTSDLNLANVFEERAEYLSRADLVQWTQLTPDSKRALSKLKGPGAKLLTGPRGSGKSTLLRAAYFELLDGEDVLPAYVNYARSLALEPLFHRNANALRIFRQWVLSKIVTGLAEAILELSHEPPSDFQELATSAQDLIDGLAAGNEAASELTELGPGMLVRIVEKLARDLGRRRIVLLLDDAAHAFSPVQQREFFEIFRELRSSRVAARAAVYPGITSYSPNMHVGHEAELIEAWYRPDSEEYLSNMRELLSHRLPAPLQQRLTGRDEIIDYLALASFGLPRAFLVMISQILGVEELPSTISRRSADEAVTIQAATVRDIFSSLAEKMPRYKHFVEVGSELERSMLRALRVFNTKAAAERKAVIIGLADPLPVELVKIIEMMEYAGLVRSVGSVSRGIKGVFQRYELHFALVIEDNSLALGRSVATSTVVEALRARDAHAFVRSRGTALLGADFLDRCTLDLAPCSFCGAPRISDDAQFCMKCGRPLAEASLYEELLKAPIDRLPLTPRKLSGLQNHTSIRSIGDVLLDEESREIRSVPYIGPIWAARIHRYADEFVSV